MNLIRYRPCRQVSPWRPLFDLHHEIDRLFDGVAPTDTGQPAFVPPVDVIERDDSIVVRADLPGIGKDDLQVTVHDGVLTLRGSRSRQEEVQEEVQEETKEGGYRHIERSHGAFARTVQLPADVDSAKITAEFKDGVLTIEAPKSAEARPRTIEISAN